MMDMDFNDDGDSEQLLQMIRQLELQKKLETKMEKFVPKESILRDSQRRTELSETISTITDILTPVMTEKMEQLINMTDPPSKLLFDTFEESMHPKVQIVYKAAKVEDLVIKEEESLAQMTVANITEA